MIVNLKYFVLLVLLVFVGCGKDDEEKLEINILSASLNGSAIPGSFTGVNPEVQVSVVFDATLSASAFEEALTVTSENGDQEFDVVYENAQTRATISMSLDFSTSYTLSISTQSIGTNGQTLSESFVVDFTTMADGTVYSMDPCTTAGSICEFTAEFEVENESLEFNFYSNYPIYLEDASWEDLTSAIIVVHGVNRNSDDYFTWMTSTLNELNLSASTILIAPSFKNETDNAGANELKWNGSNWRDGEHSSNTAVMSSFAVIDSIITQLADKQHFPVLEQVIVTGHSSGGLFTHVYGASNRIEGSFPDINFEYIVANSQFFYYPSNERFDEDNGIAYTPADCGGYNLWPLGFSSVPDYLLGVSQSELNDQFLSRSITYLLGNGNAADPTLNTSDCSATLLGSTRFKRGENIFDYLNLQYPTNTHAKTIVEGVSHDGQGMYQSPEFENLIESLINTN